MKNQFSVGLLLVLVVLFSFCTEPVQKGGGNMVDLSGKNIVMIIAPDNFRDEELLEPKGVFEDAHANVVVASKGVISSKGMLGAIVDADMDLADVCADDYDAVIFVGGSGASVYFDDPLAISLAKSAYDEGKVVGAICIAPSILANAGILDGKRATAWSSEAGNLRDKGAEYTGNAVAQDGKIITANGPRAAREFGVKVAEAMQ